MNNDELRPGAYESVVTQALADQLQALDSAAVEAVAMVPGELPDRMAMVVAELVERALAGMSDDDRATAGPVLVRELAARLMEASASVEPGDLVVVPARVLRSVATPRPDGGWHRPSRPLTPLLDTTVLTGARGEPSLSAQISSEIASADSIDLVVAFIRLTGLHPILSRLREHVASGRRLRVLTTTYTGSTEQRALDLLNELGAEVRISYDQTGTRLHAKSWLFHRNSGMSTAYVGSSNLTHQAQVTGMEWNVRLSGRRNALAVQKLTAVFASYWDGGDFLPYDPAEFARHSQSSAATATSVLTPFEITPHPFQRRMLEQLAMARSNDEHRNLVVAATGTGKTVLAALDYKSLRRRIDSGRLLFVAHRQEILAQSLTTFRHVLRDPTFGELWVGGERPDHFHHVFASVQSLAASGVERIDPTHYDVVIVDEFHHAAADTYDRLLRHLQPRELLGLTATPERADGRSVLHWFDDRITVELRLWDAIDQQRLVPFLYFGVDDGSDLRSVPRRGREYDVDALEQLYTADSIWVDRVLREVHRLVPDVSVMTALGFCASVSHASFTSAAFNRAGIPSAVVSGQTSASERERVLSDLRAGRLRVVFSVDVISEGVDIPEVDTIFLMRPTESATVFLQQLGRGLRRLEGKAACIVLDFIGVQAETFRFDLRFRAVLGGGRADLERAIREGFPYLPNGCQLILEPTPARRVLESLRSAIPSTWRQQVRELESLVAERDITLEEYLAESGLDLDDVYRGERSWMSLRAEAGLSVAKAGPHEGTMRRALGRLLHIDDSERLSTYGAWLQESTAPQVADERSRRLLRMLVASVARSVPGIGELDLERAAELVWEDARLRMDLAALIAALALDAGMTASGISPMTGHPDTPLALHARYTRDEILSAAGVRQQSVRPPAWQTGVWFEPQSSVDLLAFTLDKSAGSFSPTTRYRDYALTESLIHWESQGSTREAGAIGQRYIHHAVRGSSILLFARPTTNDRAFWFLGPAAYVSHEGERPMAITWKLQAPLPEHLYNAMAAAVA